MTQQVKENQRAERMPGQAYSTFEIWVPLEKHRVLFVQRLCDIVNNTLTEYGACVEKNIEKRLISENFASEELSPK